jgi:hypothetical protein
MIILRLQISTPATNWTLHFQHTFRLFFLYFPLFTERLQRLLQDNSHYIYDDLRRLLQPLLYAKPLLD